MAYYRPKYYGKRKYYKKRSRSVKAVTTSRAFKASAANMTQNGRFNISCKEWKSVTITANTTAAMVDFDIGNILVQAPMHDQLSKVFDQYKIEKMTLKFNLIVNNPNLSATDVSHVAFFTAIDRTGFAANATPYSIRTYGSYKETTWSVNGDTNPAHFVSIGQADLVSKSEYFDTKHIAAFPKMKIGFDAIQTLTNPKTFTVTCEIDACVRYRGVRLDTSGMCSITDMYLLDRTAEGNAKLKKVAAEIDPDTEIQINKVTANTDVTLQENHLLLTWRRYNLTIPLDQPASEPTNNITRKYWAFKCFHAKGGQGPVTINASAASPAYYIDYVDASADDNNIMLCWKDITKPGYCFIWDGITAFTSPDISMSQAMLDAGLWDLDSYFARLFPTE